MSESELFKRQRGIDLQIPAWATIDVGDQLNATSMKLMINLVSEGLATIGCAGSTLITDTLEARQITWGNGVIGSHSYPHRPLYRRAFATYTALEEFAKRRAKFEEKISQERAAAPDGDHSALESELDRLRYVAGTTIILTDSRHEPRFWSERSDVVYGFDFGTSMVFKTDDPAGLLADLAKLAEEDKTLGFHHRLREERKHFSEEQGGHITALHRWIASILLINLIAKPRFAVNTVFSVFDLHEQIVAKAMNELNLRPRFAASTEGTE